MSRYRLITGPDDVDFCARISGLLDQGYRLYGSPALTFNGERVTAERRLVDLPHLPPAGAETSWADPVLPALRILRAP